MSVSERTEAMWAIVMGALHEGWPGEWTANTRNVYRLLLADYTPEQVMAALKVWMRSGKTFRPSASEIVGILESDPGRPTWAEVYDAIYGSGRCLKVRGPARYSSPAERDRAVDEAILAKARERFHPLIAGFVATMGPRRLRMLELDDPEYGEVRKKDLRERWEQFVGVAEERLARGLPIATGGRREIGPVRLQPLAALGLEQPARELGQ